MPILQIQKRSRLLGRIRLGQKGDKGQPQKLDRFRVTSASQTVIEKVAELYGGTAQAWDNNGSPQWEVLTDARRIPIMVPPQPVSQWLETWAGGSKGCIHRCDGETNMLTGDPCNPEDPDHINAKPTTRLNVILRDVEGIGVFRLDSHGWNAAIELPDVAEFLSQVGGYVNGWLALEERTSKTDGQTRRFVVPIIEVDVTPAQLMAGEGRVAAPTLEGPVQPVAALGSSTPPAADDYTPYFERLAAATMVPECQALWTEMVQAKLMGTQAEASARTAEFLAAFTAKGAELNPDAPVEPNADGTYDAKLVDDADAVWEQIIAEGGRLGMGLGDLQDGFAEHMGGLTADSASAGELAQYLEHLRAGAAA